MRSVTHPRSAVSATALVVLVAIGAPAAAQITPLESVPGDLSAFILPIESTIIGLEGGTATTTSVEEVAITLEADVFFEFDEADLLPEAEDLLGEVVDEIAEAGVTELRIGGHTDSVGTDAYNQDLSERRAESVEAFLSDRLDGVAFTTEGFAAREPVAANETEDGEDDPEGRALNRRVELRYTP
jgi:OOP family OmpA-OmpF porin